MPIYVNNGAETSSIDAMQEISKAYVNNGAEWRNVEAVMHNPGAASSDVNDFDIVFVSEAETRDHLSRVVATPSNNTILALNNMIKTLKKESLWPKIDILSVSQGDEYNSRLNIRGNEFHGELIAEGTATAACYTSTLGFRTNGSASAYIELSAAEDSLSLYAKNDGHFWAYVTENQHFSAASAVYPVMALNNGFNVSGSNESHINFASSTWLIYGQENTTEGLGIGQFSATASPQSVGFLGYSMTGLRDRFAQQQQYQQEITVAGAVADAYVLGSSNIRIGAQTEYGPLAAFNKSRFGVAGWGVGSGLTSSEMSSLERIIQQYYTTLGINSY